MKYIDPTTLRITLPGEVVIPVSGRLRSDHIPTSDASIPLVDLEGISAYRTAESHPEHGTVTQRPRCSAAERLHSAPTTTRSHFLSFLSPFPLTIPYITRLRLDRVNTQINVIRHKMNLLRDSADSFAAYIKLVSPATKVMHPVLIRAFPQAVNGDFLVWLLEDLLDEVTVTLQIHGNILADPVAADEVILALESFLSFLNQPHITTFDLALYNLAALDLLCTVRKRPIPPHEELDDLNRRSDRLLSAIEGAPNKDEINAAVAVLQADHDGPMPATGELTTLAAHIPSQDAFLEQAAHELIGATQRAGFAGSVSMGLTHVLTELRRDGKFPKCTAYVLGPAHGREVFELANNADLFGRVVGVDRAAVVCSRISRFASRFTHTNQGFTDVEAHHADLGHYIIPPGAANFILIGRTWEYLNDAAKQHLAIQLMTALPPRGRIFFLVSLVTQAANPAVSFPVAGQMVPIAKKLYLPGELQRELNALGLRGRDFVFEKKNTEPFHKEVEGWLLRRK